MVEWVKRGIEKCRRRREKTRLFEIEWPDDLSNLNVGDVEFGKGAMWVKIRSSKADQKGRVMWCLLMPLMTWIGVW
jgi:hypothetical protein